VLGSSLQSIVVPTPDDAVRAAQWLRENNGGRASFLVAGLHGGSDEAEGARALLTTTLACRLEERPALANGQTENFRDDLRISDLLGAPQQLVTVLKRTLPEKMNARLAANLDDAMLQSIGYRRDLRHLERRLDRQRTVRQRRRRPAISKKAPDCSRSNANSANWKRERKVGR
jgi:hypothetical protein